MKTLLLFLLSITISAVIYAQVPQALNYQAIARNLDGSIVSGQSIRVRFSILDGSAAGTVVYQEAHQTTPNNFGVFTLAIGSGSVISGSFSGINWSKGSKFLKVEIAPQGGTNFNLQGTTQLLSVPYALYAEKSGSTSLQEPIGANGKTVLNGAINPTAATGTDGDFYINTATNQIFGPKTSGAWGAGINLTGPAGAPGATGPAGAQGSAGIAGTPGPAGANGKTILSGTINPTAASGSDGDFYINTATNQIFGPKTSGAWGTAVNLTGPRGPIGLTGPAGPQGNAGVAGSAGATGATGPVGPMGPAGLQGSTGVAGTPGPAGANGKTILSGTINPTATSGSDGDFYINTATNQIFGPKTSGAWGTAVDLTGPSGVKSLIDLQNFPGTAACPAGGITIKSGVDKDNNNILDLSEVDNTKDICFTQKASLDKLIILPIFNSVRSTSTTFPIIVGDLLKFNKNNYPLVDSIIFIADPYINGISSVTAIVNLYNKTDNIPVANSTLTSNNVLGSNQFLQTGNLYSSLPNYDINLGISVQSSSGIFVTSSLAGCYLYLYRK